MAKANGRAALEFSLAARLKSFYYAGRGLRTMLVTQHNAWIHAAASVAAVGGGAVLGVSRVEWLALILAIVGVWTAEALNTAFEFLCDVASPDFHPLVEKAKDVAAGAVLVCAVGALAVGWIIFAPHLAWLSGHRASTASARLSVSVVSIAPSNCRSLEEADHGAPPVRAAAVPLLMGHRRSRAGSVGKERLSQRYPLSFGLRSRRDVSLRSAMSVRLAIRDGLRSIHL